MTKQEYQDKMAAIAAERVKLNEKERAIQKEYIDSYAYKVGDKVKVTTHKGEFIVFVGVLTAGWSGVDIQFNKVKLDGTMSGQSAALYSWETIELIEPATAATQA